MGLDGNCPSPGVKCRLMKFNGARFFQRREDYPPSFHYGVASQPPKTPSASPFRKFPPSLCFGAASDVKCLACGSYQLRLVAQMDAEAGEMTVVLVCNRCPQREILPVR